MNKEEFKILAKKHLTAIELPRNEKGEMNVEIFGFDKLYEAIDFTDSSLQLKDRKALTFDEYVSKFYTINKNEYTSKRNTIFIYDKNEVQGNYNNYCLNF